MRFLDKDEIKLAKIYMKRAWELARKSNCKEANFGAVIVNPEGKILGEGYNWVPEILGSCDECPRRKEFNFKGGVGREICYARHAERDAIFNAIRKGYNLKDSTMYVGHMKNGKIKTTRGKPNCTNCAQEIYLSGIKEVVFFAGKDKFLAFDSKEFLILSYKNLVENYKKQVKGLFEI